MHWPVLFEDTYISEYWLLQGYIFWKYPPPPVVPSGENIKMGKRKEGNGEEKGSKGNKRRKFELNVK
jgi:hypothetical protein